MHRHRFRDLLARRPIPGTTPLQNPIMHGHLSRDPVARGPTPGTPAAVPMSGFMMCPLAMPQGAMGQMLLWQQAYQLAFEQARAAAQPSPLERLTASLN